MKVGRQAEPTILKQYDLCACTDVNKNNQIYYGIECAGHKS